MIFHEIYSVYYQTVAKILTAANGSNTSELRRIILQNAFAESHMAILPALESGRWPLLTAAGTSILEHEPTMPLTLLEKRWLKSLLDDPRLKLFGVELPGLEDVKPLFTREDYRVYDRYLDGDPYADQGYIQRFQTVLEAIRTMRPLAAQVANRRGGAFWVRFYPIGLEYSAKDDKFRVLAQGCKQHHFNLARIQQCTFYDGFRPIKHPTRMPRSKTLTLEITDSRNALERVMLHFAHFEKQCERLPGEKYLLRLQYSDADETELVIRVLSFGPRVRVLSPDSFIDLIKERLQQQKDSGIR